MTLLQRVVVQVQSGAWKPNLHSRLRLRAAVDENGALLPAPPFSAAQTMTAFPLEPLPTTRCDRSVALGNHQQAACHRRHRVGNGTIRVPAATFPLRLLVCRRPLSPTELRQPEWRCRSPRPLEGGLRADGLTQQSSTEPISKNSLMTKS
jgi:hypothetical protein